jgi:hypothetical protein
MTAPTIVGSIFPSAVFPFSRAELQGQPGAFSPTAELSEDAKWLRALIEEREARRRPKAVPA